MKSLLVKSVMCFGMLNVSMFGFTHEDKKPTAEIIKLGRQLEHPVEIPAYFLLSVSDEGHNAGIKHFDVYRRFGKSIDKIEGEDILGISSDTKSFRTFYKTIERIPGEYIYWLVIQDKGYNVTISEPVTVSFK